LWDGNPRDLLVQNVRNLQFVSQVTSSPSPCLYTKSVLWVWYCGRTCNSRNYAASLALIWWQCKMEQFSFQDGTSFFHTHKSEFSVTQFVRLLSPLLSWGVQRTSPISVFALTSDVFYTCYWYTPVTDTPQLLTHPSYAPQLLIHPSYLYTPVTRPSYLCTPFTYAPQLLIHPSYRIISTDRLNTKWHFSTVYCSWNTAIVISMSRLVGLFPCETSVKVKASLLRTPHYHLL
jgi:hypothetical protein